MAGWGFRMGWLDLLSAFSFGAGNDVLVCFLHGAQLRGVCGVDGGVASTRETDTITEWQTVQKNIVQSVVGV